MTTSFTDIPADFNNLDLSFPDINTSTSSPEEIEKYCSDLVSLRKKACGHLLHPGWSFTTHIAPYATQRGNLPRHPSRRPLPIFAHEGGTYQISLTTALQPFIPGSDIHTNHCAQWSQVWIADVYRTTTPPSQIPSPSLGSVVLKIFQSSLIPIPRPSDLPINQGNNHFFSRQLANTEFFVYERLRPIQGFYVPYCYARCKAIVPNGEEVRIVILEHINGRSLDAWCQKFFFSSKAEQEAALDNELSPILHKVHESVQALDGHGVYHRDATQRNLILTDGPAVVIDFALSYVDYDHKLLVPESASAVTSILTSCYHDYNATVTPWTDRPGYLPAGVAWHRPT